MNLSIFPSPFMERGGRHEVYPASRTLLQNFRDAGVVKKLRRDDIGEYRHLGECLSAFLFG